MKNAHGNETQIQNVPLLVAGVLSSLASLTHIAIIIGGPAWYRTFGAGEEMAQMAENGDMYPALITSAIAAILAVWAAYAFAGAGLIRTLPFMRFCLLGISAIFILRAALGFLVVLFSNHPSVQEWQGRTTFMMVSSLIVLLFGLAYAVGTAQRWRHLTPK
ncbi:MAG: hypothetical protein JKY60_08615 [Kordiimonadaceae bacterium]|nr:hypothetical protein [Kordiimonadaceae bacterium]